jgi:hypothetical protein
MKAVLFFLAPSLCCAQFTTVTCAGDGSTDVTSCINTILAANDLVFFPTPAVCYRISGALQLHSGQTIMGAKRPPTGGNGGICSYSTTADALFASAGTSGARNITIENMQIYDAVSSTRTSGAAIHIDGTSDATVIDIHDNQTLYFQDGLWISETLNSSVSRNRFTSPIRDGVHQSLPSTSTGFYNNYVDNPGNSCYYITNLVYSTFDSNACDSAGSDGYHFDAASPNGPIRGIALNGNGAEQPAGNGMYLDGQSFTVNSPVLTTVGAGMAGILVIGSNIQIANAYLTGGKYGISLPNPPARGGSSTSVVVTNPYFLGQTSGPYNDPHSLIQKPF